MKKCTYCGNEYSDEAILCELDGEPLFDPTAPKIKRKSFLKSPGISGGFGIVLLCIAGLFLICALGSDSGYVSPVEGLWEQQGGSRIDDRRMYLMCATPFFILGVVFIFVRIGILAGSEADSDSIKNENNDKSENVSPPVLPKYPQLSHKEIMVVAKRQNVIMWLILVSIPAYAAAVLVPFLPLIACIISLVFIYKLAVALKEPWPWAYVMLGLIPCVSIIALIVIYNRASSTLKANGVRVGLMGARKDDLEKITTIAN